MVSNLKSLITFNMSNLKEIRKSLHLTQVQLSALTGVRQATIADIENGKDCSTATLRKIAEALKCNLSIVFVPTK